MRSVPVTPTTLPTLDVAGLAERVRTGGSVTLAVGRATGTGAARMLFLRLPDGTSQAIDLACNDGLGPLAQALSHVELVVEDARETITAVVDQLGVRAGRIFDVRIAGVLLHAARDKRTPPLWVPPLPAIGDVPASLITQALAGVAHLSAMATAHRQDLAREQMQTVAGLEFAALPAVLDMRRNGLRVDRARWTHLVEGSVSEIGALEHDLRAELGVQNLRSQDQLVAALRTKGFDVERTGKGALSRFLPHPLIQKVIRYQQQASFVADQGQALLRALDRSPDGRVRADIDPVGAVTGRMTASDPNLLGLPRDPEVRGCFVPKDGYVFIAGDYATCELRAIADIANDSNLREIFVRGGDPHRRTAGQLLGKRDEEVTDDERKKAKPANFGALYGITAYGLVDSALKNYGVTLTFDAATALLDGFKRSFPHVAAWQNNIAKKMPETMRTATGRLRRFGRGEGVEPRLNFPVQGVCADGMKHAIGLLYPQLAVYEAHLLLAIHDELLVEVPRESAAAVKALLVDCMTRGMATFVTSVPIVVDAQVRATWSSKSGITSKPAGQTEPI